jgi:predicted ArsR family transcriptional regulator
LTFPNRTIVLSSQQPLWTPWVPLTPSTPLSTHSQTESNHRHLLLLEELDCQTNVSQRRLAEHLGLPASLVNRLIAELTDSGYVDVVDTGVRPFAYRVSPAGREYRRQLSHARFKSVVGTYREVQDRSGLDCKG